MKMRQLGQSQIEIPPVVFGGNVFGWTVDETASFRLLDELIDVGLNAIDTADVYSAWVPGHTGGESETILGKWMRARNNRDRVTIATKVGMAMGTNKGLSANWIAEAVEASLRRLQTDCIDLYQAHVDDTEVPLEETLGAFSRLIEAGKVRAIGCSNYTAERLQAALDISRRHGLPRYESVQPQYNLIHRNEFEGNLAELCAHETIGSISFFGLAAGFLSGKYRTSADLKKSSRGNRVAGMMNERNLAILDVLIDVARAEHATPSSVATAWLISRPHLTAPIVSATSSAQLQEIVGAVSLELSPESLRALEAVSA
ncbi:aldo/keto reductase [Aquamicrobium sp. LC103]|uniref:aldo/keto reductase n=1 Tax=Aquamicrobium sp. LC103 TaxID=1120658 RepID=UPI00063EB3DB|nr:aldo/keto reductase [Aquamicrobium sp. LC103]TKT75839.1 aldo/keto reductase [Aquamicrobium sp. LC103]